MLGVVVAGAFEFLDDRLHNAKDIRKLLPAEVIGEIPAIVNLSDAQNINRKIWFGWATATFVFATILVGSAFSYLRG
jgi:hypothetical protein